MFWLLASCAPAQVQPETSGATDTMDSQGATSPDAGDPADVDIRCSGTTTYDTPIDIGVQPPARPPDMRGWAHWSEAYLEWLGEYNAEPGTESTQEEWSLLLGLNVDSQGRGSITCTYYRTEDGYSFDGFTIDRYLLWFD